MDTDPAFTALRAGERLIVSALRDRGGATRRELADLTRLPRTTVTATVAALIARGILAESTPPPDGPRPAGRPAPTVRVDLSGRCVTVVELGRTRQSSHLVGLDGTVLGSRGLTVDLTRPFEAVAADLAAAAEDSAAGGHRPSALVVSVAMPFRQGAGAPPFPLYGPVPPRRPRTGWVLTDPAARPPDALGVPAMLRTDPSAELADMLGMPVAIENDVNLAALGEAVHGAARGARTAVYLSVVPGFGAGIVIDGRLFRGAGGVAGELAHISVRDDGDLCLCGNRGCITTLRRNGPGLVDDIEIAFGRQVTLEEVVALAAAGHDTVRRWLADLGRSMARPPIGFVTMLNPDLLVVDSSLGPAAEPVVEGLREAVERGTAPMTHDGLAVRAGVLTTTAVPVGAAGPAMPPAPRRPGISRSAPCWRCASCRRSSGRRSCARGRRLHSPSPCPPR